MNFTISFTHVNRTNGLGQPLTGSHKNLPPRPPSGRLQVELQHPFQYPDAVIFMLNNG